MGIKIYEENKVGRDFVIGDIHGMYDLLISSLDSIGFNKQDDRLFSVGDLIDRGPDSFKCLNLVYEDWFIPVLGNHEDMMFKAVLDGSEPHFNCWIQNGGSWFYQECATKTEVGEFVNVLNDIRDRFPEAVQINKTAESVGVVHADAPDVWSNEAFEDNQDLTIWGRSRLPKNIAPIISGIDFIYAGHTPIEAAPKKLGNIIYIDSGAFHTNKLTIVEL